MENYFYSNCLFEAIKAKIKDPKNVHIHFFRSESLVWPHFWWEKGEEALSFVSVKLHRKFQVFYFKGYIDITPIRLYRGYARSRKYIQPIMTKKRREAIIAQNKIDYPELYEDED